MVFDSGDSHRVRLTHCVVSVYDDGSELDHQRETARAVARRHGIEGGLTVFHHVRSDKYDGPGSNDGTVHFHIIGIDPSGIEPGGDDKDESGQLIVFKVIQDDEYKDMRGFRSGRAVKRAIQYLLTHCGVIEGKHALTWFGCLSYNRMSRQAIDNKFPGALEDLGEGSRECPVCGSTSTEPCLQREPLFSWGDSDHLGRPVGAIEVLAHPEPSWEAGKPGRYEVLWEVIRKTLLENIKDERRNGLSQDALEHYLQAWPLEDLDNIIRWNLKTSRLQQRGEILSVARPEFGLDGALVQMKWMFEQGVPARNGDPELVRIIKKIELERHDCGAISDIEFVFGSLMERYLARARANQS